MRVIAGSARGRTLAAPKGLATRPTPGRVKEALFSMLAATVEGSVVLDLFAGTGALGLEALSRGAARSVFVETDRHALEALKKNLAAVAPDRGEILPMPAERALRLLSARHERFDLAFLDPPYERNLLPASLRTLAESALIADCGVVVCEHHGKAAPPLPPSGWHERLSRRYGDVAITLLAVGKGAQE